MDQCCRSRKCAKRDSGRTTALRPRCATIGAEFGQSRCLDAQLSCPLSAFAGAVETSLVADQAGESSVWDVDGAAVAPGMRSYSVRLRGSIRCPSRALCMRCLVSAATYSSRLRGGWQASSASPAPSQGELWPIYCHVVTHPCATGISEGRSDQYGLRRLGNRHRNVRPCSSPRKR